MHNDTGKIARLLTVPQVAERTQLSVRSIRRKIAAGQLPAVQIGGPHTAVRVDERELNQFLYGEPK